MSVLLTEVQSQLKLRAADQSPITPLTLSPWTLRAPRWEMGSGWTCARAGVYVCCVCMCVTPVYKIRHRHTEHRESVLLRFFLIIIFFLLHAISVKKKNKSKWFYFCSLDSHDVPLQRSAASSLSGVTASSRGSPRAPDPVTTLGLPGGGSPPAEPACHLPAPDFLLQKPGGCPPAQHAAGRLCPAVGSQHRAGCAPELRPADPQQPRLSANCLPRLRLPQIRRPCDTGTVYTER